MPAPTPPDAPSRVRVRACRAHEPAYPAGLRDLADLPPVVYLAGGELPPLAGAVALVGSRAASRYGMEQARRLAADLAALGLVVVSGLARGIDAAAHRGALDAGGRTVAVIPSGLDAITPRHHRDLAVEIVARGALVSEWEHGDPRGLGVFVQRNRLIAALAGATVVVEAAERSGALTTAGFARALGRPVLAVPGDVDRDTARGCHALLRRGAALCECAGDVLEAMRRAARPTADTAQPQRTSDASTGRGHGTAQARLLGVLSADPATVEALAADAGITVPEALGALLALQWAGVASARPGQRWTRSTA